MTVPKNRLRLLSVQVAVQVVSDDGDTLTPIPCPPITLTAAEWATFDLDAALAPVRAQVEQPES